MKIADMKFGQHFRNSEGGLSLRLCTEALQYVVLEGPNLGAVVRCSTTTEGTPCNPDGSPVKLTRKDVKPGQVFRHPGGDPIIAIQLTGSRVIAGDPLHALYGVWKESHILTWTQPHSEVELVEG